MTVEAVPSPVNVRFVLTDEASGDVVTVIPLELVYRGVRRCDGRYLWGSTRVTAIPRGMRAAIAVDQLPARCALELAWERDE